MMKNMFLPLIIMFNCVALTVLDAAGPGLTKTDLFHAGQDGYKLYRIPGIVVTKQGTVLAYCEARKSDSGDWGRIDVLMRRSVDGGRTWSLRNSSCIWMATCR